MTFLELFADGLHWAWMQSSQADGAAQGALASPVSHTVEITLKTYAIDVAKNRVAELEATSAARPRRTLRLPPTTHVSSAFRRSDLAWFNFRIVLEGYFPRIASNSLSVNAGIVSV
jgi:hypothetical protein